MNKQFTRQSFYFVILLLFGLFSCDKEEASITAYTVDFDCNGGTKIESQEVLAGEKVTTPTDPTKEGHEFLYWTKNDQEYDFSKEVVDDFTLTALWEEIEVTYQVTYKFDNGQEDSVATVIENNLLEAPQIPLKEGFIFKFWSEDGAEFKFGEAVTSNIELTAIYEEVIDQYVVSFDPNNGEQMTLVTVDEDTEVTEPENPQKEDYEFLGWFLNDELYDFTSKVNGDITLIAKWKIVAGETTFEYATISRDDFNSLSNGDHIMVKAQLNYLSRGWAWGTEVYLVDNKENSSKDLYSHSNYGMFTFPLSVASDDPMMGGTYVFNLVKDVYMSSPQLGFGYMRNEEFDETGTPAYDGGKWNAPMRYGIEFFDEIIRGNVREVNYSAEKGLSVVVGTEEVMIKKRVEDGQGNITYENLSESDTSLFDDHLEQNRYIYTIQVEGETVSVLNKDTLQVYASILP
ncbi:InlB B-repeat-containing protein [Flammeovirga agarivorans]|uniref:InlB B-repeat-containing protein n=1 Tax=Flammeovirga agarivorans TaxID=2726742 RepID=A0A7X8XXX1_9BACT|nr:InlB B-repeat-containing protein [Flammeovirga agarivorans]NLR93661.1 InlB B-repeat-containing protein [Flammeovirga agarivorans]